MKKQTRRKFLTSSFKRILLLATIPTAAGIWIREKTIRPVEKVISQTPLYYNPATIMLPGAENEEEFYRKCIRCFLCGEVCPRKAVRFHGSNAGLYANTPYILPAERGCDLCMDCVKVCPTGALLEHKPEEVKMGKVVLIENLCLPYIDRGYCGACVTICPVRAVREGFKLRPEVDLEKCVGCGICEEICPVDAKAIRTIPA